MLSKSRGVVCLLLLLFFGVRLSLFLFFVVFGLLFVVFFFGGRGHSRVTDNADS